MGFCYGSNYMLAKKCLPKDNGNAKESSGIFAGTDDKTNGSLHFIRLFFPMRCNTYTTDNMTPSKLQLSSGNSRNLYEYKENENNDIREEQEENNINSYESESTNHVGHDVDENGLDEDMGIVVPPHVTNEDNTLDESMYNARPFNIYGLDDDLDSQITEEKLYEMIDALEDIPSKNDIINIWKLAYHKEENKFSDMLNDLFGYFENLKDTHNIDAHNALEIWENCITTVSDILLERETYYIKRFYDFIIKDPLTKNEFVHFFNTCKNESDELRAQLDDLGRSELNKNMIPQN
ncbi:Plasmodium exported protein (PHIST), unknown function [Plasmodium ovale wallikeri]|uniref:Plasmodium RESA N-terminal domain-containing protein n=2 Tax=Plasmodium ovale TaxID=36330 RepID=A0A1A8Z6X6_PLAOA|nr:Phist protein (Pf-fam-b), unknown function [Plasmodium ovale wallikeri]SBT40085.1 Plasmodium exported protein (PHIST), unknown function [Plasmodium ovale wallikeri]SBT77900.1 Plasmodium exported protein, unknown function [Plasmodium ovale]